MTSRPSTRWIELGAMGIAAIAALAASIQTVLVFQQRDDVVRAISLEQAALACADVVAHSIEYGLELDGFVSAARRTDAFARSEDYRRQVLRIYDARLQMRVTIERFAAFGPEEVADEVAQLFVGSTRLDYSTLESNVEAMDRYTAALSEGIEALRTSCREGLERV